jgi:hypothetical protein
MFQFSEFPEGTWLVFSNNRTSDVTFLTDTRTRLDCAFLVAEQVHMEVSLTEVYYVHFTRPLLEYHVANWNSVRGIVWFVSPQRRHLQGVKINVAFRKQVISVVIHSFGRLAQLNVGRNSMICFHCRETATLLQTLPIHYAVCFVTDPW